MPPLPTPAYRLDVWSASVTAGGTRTAFLVDAGGRAAADVQRTRSLEAGQSQLTFTVAPDFHALAALAPNAGVVRLTRFMPTSATAYTEQVEEWRVRSRTRVVRRGVGPWQIVCVPLEEDLLDSDTYREVGSGGLATWRYGATDRTPTQVLTDVRDRLLAIGLAGIDVGTVTPTALVTFELQRTATPRAIVTALIAALDAQGIACEFQFPLEPGLTEYRLELVTAVASSYAALLASTDTNLSELHYEEDGLEQATTVIPFGDDGVDLSDVQVAIAAVDAGTGWITLEALDGSDPLIVAVDDQYNGRRLFRELTGRSFAISDTSASPQRVQLAVGDLASGLAAGERISFRETEDNAGERRGFATAAKYSPAEVVSTLAGPARIRTRDLADAGNFLDAANAYRDWALERSTLVATLPTGDFDHATGVFDMASAPAATPAAGDWLWFPLGGVYVPATVVSYNGGTYALTLTPRYRGQQFTTSQTGITGVKCYRPIGTPMWIHASLVANNEFTVDAFTSGTPAATDVCELIQRCQGTRLVELTDPAAATATRRKVATLDVPGCTGATNRVPNGAMVAWAGAPDTWLPGGYSIASIVGTVKRNRESSVLCTRYGGYSWKLDFGYGASAQASTARMPVHPVVGAQSVSCAVALLFERFTGNIPLTVTLSKVTAAGTQTALGDPITIYPPDTTVMVDAAFTPALNAWYDAVITDQSIADLSDETLQLSVTRPAGATNPECVVYVDACMLLVRSGLPQAEEGGVRYGFDADGIRMLAAGNALLLERSYPTLRFEADALDLFRLSALDYAPWELVLGRMVTLTVPPLAVTRTVRIVQTAEDLDDPTRARVAVDRLRPDVARQLAAQLKTPPRVPGDVPPIDITASVYTTCDATRVTITPTTVVVRATGSASVGTPTVQLVGVASGTATLDTGPAIGVPSASGQQWTFTRGVFGAGAAQVEFRAVLAGSVSDSDFVTIPDQSRDTVPLVMRARVTASTPTTVTVRVAVADPYPQGANTATITYSELGLGAATSPVSPQTVTPAATLTEAASTYVDFTVTRPAYGTGTGRITFTVTASSRTSDSDAVDVPAVESTGPVLDVKVTPSAASYDIVITYTGTMTYKIDGGDDVDGTASPQTLTVSRTAFGLAALEYVFKAVLNGQTITAPVQVPAAAIGTITLAISACIASNAGAAPPPYNQLDVPFTYSGMPAGAVFDVSFNNGVSGGMDSATDIAMATSPQTRTFSSVTFAGTPGRGAVTVVAKLNGQVLATAVRNKTYVT